MSDSKKPNLGAFANLGKIPEAKPTPAPKPQPDTPRAAKRPAARVAPVGGRKITVRDLTDEDLRRLAEFRYTHRLSIQALAIEGLSRALMARGLKPLSGYVAPADE